MLDEKKVRELSEKYDLGFDDELIRKFTLDAKLDIVIDEMLKEQSTVEVVGTLMSKAHAIMYETRKKAEKVHQMLTVIGGGEND